LKKHNIFNPVAIYGYYPCRSDGEDLYIFNQEEGFGDLKKSDLKKAIYKLHFPKSPKGIGLSDYFDSEFNDIVAFTCVSAGSGFSKYEEILHKEGRFQEYYLMHGLGAQLAEALAHILHKQIRIDLQILKDEEAFLKDIKKSSFQGCRYSFGYPACPELSYNKIIFELLKPERFGITLSESFLMVPEQTTTAMVLYHPEAKYF
jgi:5-methyltetrahydrofolate--homocysteine methyltransferase